MTSNGKLVVLLGLVTIMASQANAVPTLMPNMCSAHEKEAMPCVCCRKACWFGITEMTTNYFGNMPGENNDAEARFTIAMMQQCFKLECSDACSSTR